MTYPKVNIKDVSTYKISSHEEKDTCLATISFDQDVVEYTLNVLGTSHNTGTVAHSGSRTVDEMMNYTVDQMLNFTVDDARAISSETDIIAEIDSSELYQEGQNRVNIYGRNLSNEWTPYVDEG